MLRYAHINAADLTVVVPQLAQVDPRILARIDIDGEVPPDLGYAPNDPPSGTYSAQLFRQQADLRYFMADEQFALDPDMDYHTVDGLSSEVKERLFNIRPTTLVCWTFSLDIR